MDSQDIPDLNLSASGDQNKTILLDTTASPEKSENNGDSPVEIEQEVTPQQSTGSLRMLDLNDLNDEELLSQSNNLKNESGDQLSKQDEKSKEPTIDKDEPIVSNVANEEDDDAGLLEIVPVKPKKPDELDEDVSLLRSVALCGTTDPFKPFSNPNYVPPFQTQDVEETVLERLIGLTEMFPDRVRNVGYSILTGTFPLIKRTYAQTRTYGWIFFSTFALLVVPVSLEKERCQAQRDLSRQVREVFSVSLCLVTLKSIIKNLLLSNLSLLFYFSTVQMLLGGGNPPAGAGQVGMAPAPVSK